MSIYNRSKLVARTFVEQLNILFGMGKQLEAEVGQYSDDIAEIKVELTKKNNVIIATTITLDHTTWIGNEQVILIEPITPDSVVWVAPAIASMVDYGTCKVMATAQGDSTLTFTCEVVPANDLYVTVVISDNTN